MKLIRAFVDFLTRLIGFIRRNNRCKILNDPNRVIKLNLGCGLAVSSDWINIDASLNAFVASWPRIFHKLFYSLSGSNRYYTFEQYHSLLKNHTFIHHDLARSIPVDNNVASFIYSSHFLEHLFKSEAYNLLKESYRALKSGGVIRICVPDLAYAVFLYHNEKKEEMLENYFFIEDQNSFLARHKYMYDFQLLKSNLEEIGFSNVIQCEYRKGQTPDLNILDNRAEETLFVEAVKP
jgi:predicted SAM-dependent methyltransferase